MPRGVLQAATRVHYGQRIADLTHRQPRARTSSGCSDGHPAPGLFASPSGEQAALDDPPDSTPPLDTPQEFSGAGSHQVRDELPERKVRTAVRYYAAYREDIDDRIAANREVAQEAEAAWQAEQDLLRGNDRAS